MVERPSPPKIILLGAEPAFEQLCSEVVSAHGWPQDTLRSHRTVPDTFSACDLIISDLAIPSAVERVLSCASTVSCKRVLLVSPQAAQNDPSGLDLLRRGAHGILTGPVDHQALFSTLQALLCSNHAGGAGLFPHVHTSLVSMSIDTAEAAHRRLTLCFADELEAQGRLAKSERKKLELAFQEALANAVEHGNLELDSAWREIIDAQGIDRYSQLKAQRLSDAYYSSRKVVISFECRDDRYFIRVRDEGSGFNPPLADSFPQQSTELKCSGRGIAIIVDSVDELGYAHGGREICMCKYVPLPSNQNKGCNGT